MSRTISYTVKDNCTVPSSPQWGGMQYENNATAVEYSLDADFLNDIEAKFGTDIKLCYRIDFDSPVSGYHPSESLEMSDGKITRFIPEAVTAGGEPFQTCLVITVLDAEACEKAIIMGTPTRIYLSQVIRDEFTEQRAATNVSAAEQKVTELLDDTRYFSAESEKFAKAAAAAAETAVTAEKKTEEAKVALEEGSEFIFLGGDAKSSINIEIAVDDSLSATSENAVQNKVIDEILKGFEIEINTCSELCSETAEQFDGFKNDITACLSQNAEINETLETMQSDLDNCTQNNSVIIENMAAVQQNVADCLERDYIVEQGTSGNWTYRKWSSGIAECWGLFTGSSVNYATGGLGYLHKVEFEYPFTFANSSTIPTAIVKYGSGLASIVTFTSTNSKCTLVFDANLSGSEEAAASGYTVALEVKGKWE